MQDERSLVPRLLGRGGPRIVACVRAAREYLESRDVPALLAQVGRTIAEIPPARHFDKRFFQASFRGDANRPQDDLVTGKGLFYVSEQRRLLLDCTAGHYQMTWGYNHPQLNALVRQAIEEGIVWDNHSNIPGDAVKRLSLRLVAAANGLASAPSRLVGDDKALNRVLLGVCTGSVATSTALKLALAHHREVRSKAAPVLVSLRGNYHGTDFLAQRLRGMWREYFRGITFVQVEPNDADELRRTFAAYRGRVAAMFAEPILMNREAILLDREFLREARALCDEAGACLVIDEIQTGFWFPRFFLCHDYGIVPDVLVVGKGMTSGLHPLAAVVYRGRYDRLAQYDAISTNGNAPLAAVAALGCMELVEAQGRRLETLRRHYFDRLGELPAAAPRRVAAIHGKGLVAGVKFRAVDDALEFHRRCLERGLWARVHAYHPGHSTVLTKLALAADRRIADFVVDTFQKILEEMDHG